MCFIFMTELCKKHLVLMQQRYVCTLKMGYWSLSCVWMEMRLHIASYITVCICYPQVRLLECHPRELVLHFTVCLVTNCSSDVNTTATQGNIYYLNDEVKMLNFILLSYQRGFRKSGLAALDIHIVCHIPYKWLSKYNIKFCHKTHECSQWQLPVHCRLHLIIRK
jgi:hypothetical protein